MLAILLMAATYFFGVRNLDRQLTEEWTDPAADSSRAPAVPASPQLLASHFQDGERFYLKIPRQGGGTLMAFCDTGGGLSMLIPGAEQDNDLHSKLHYGVVKGLLPVKYLLFEDLVGTSDYPQPHALPSQSLRTPFKRVTQPYLIIPPMNAEMKFMTTCMPEMQAFMGQSFFLGKAWTFDYKKQEVWVHTPLHASAANDPDVLPLGFKKNQHQSKIFGHPSLTIEVDGEAIDVLFDTGATMVLSSAGKQSLGTDQATLGGSFIAVSIYNKWRAEHPDWPHYPGADLAGSVIEVPRVRVGGHEVGPVRFASRPDENWSQGMIASMDRVVRGAIGGTLLKHFKITADYNTELIRFER